MKILAIGGTNRRQGSISRMTKKTLEGAMVNGHETELLNLYDFTINHCLGCWKCSRSGKCHFKDDFEVLHEKMQKAEIVIIGCPVYWGDVPGIVKDFFDRHTAIMSFPDGVESIREKTFARKIKFALNSMKSFGPKNIEDRHKKFLFIISATTPFKRLFNEIPSVITTLKIFTKKMRGKIIGKLIYTDTLIRFKDKESKMMKRAYKIVRRL
ncbi:MAG: flavodoxin family protein [Asgard group archaeon]|nr:flavodoxin family protein [Asgard group archaeon]